MRIVFISLIKKDLGGGGGRVPYEMALRLASQHDTVLMYPGDQTGLQEAENGLKIFTTKSAGEGDVFVAALSAKDVNQIFNFLDEFNADIIHAHSPISTCLIGQTWAKMHNVPFVVTAHALPSKALDFAAFDAIKALTDSLSNLLVQPGLYNFYENCDAIIALNRFAVEDIRQFGYEGKIFLIPNGRDLDRYRVCANADLSSPERILTFAGYLSERKNQLFLLEALKHLPQNYKLQLIGEALPLTTSYAQLVREFTQEHDLNVVFTGQVDHQDIPSHLAETHVLVSASKMEVQSLVVIEALASGTPVVGLSNETIDELVDEEVGCNLPKEASPEEFAQSVERICTLPQPEYDKMCEQARDRVKQFDWSNVMSLTVEAYESLLKDRPPIAEKSRTRLEKTLTLIPPGEARDTLAAKIASLEKTAEGGAKVEPESRLTSRMKKAKRVPKSSWFFFILTVSLSPLLYLFTRCVTFFRRKKKANRP